MKDVEQPLPETTEEPDTELTEKEETGGTPDYGLSADDIKALFALYKNRDSIDLSCAERINEAFADGYGDVILEYDGEEYRIIEDYEEEVGEWLRSLMK